MVVSYTSLKTRSIEASLIKELTSWSRPDSLCIDINPGIGKLKNISIYLLANGATEPWECTLEPKLVENALNRVEMPMDTFVNLKDMGAYPIKITKIRFVPKDAANTEVTLQIPRFSWVYSSVPADASGVEDVAADAALVLTPNPVNAGEVVRLGVAEPVKYTVTALNGAVVAQGEGMELSTAGFSAGVYVVKVGSVSGKLIVK